MARRTRIWIGAFLVGAGLLFNKWILEATLIPDGRIGSQLFIAGIVAVQVALVAAGIAVLTCGEDGALAG